MKDEITDKEYKQRCHDFEMGLIEGKSKFNLLDFLRGVMIGMVLTALLLKYA